MIYRSFLIVIGLAVFVAITSLPFFFWSSASEGLPTHGGHGTDVDWLMGMSMLIWLPVTVVIAAAVAFFLTWALWPKRKVTIGQAYERKLRGQRP